MQRVAIAPNVAVVVVFTLPAISLELKETMPAQKQQYKAHQQHPSAHLLHCIAAQEQQTRGQHTLVIFWRTIQAIKLLSRPGFSPSAPQQLNSSANSTQTNTPTNHAHGSHNVLNRISVAVRPCHGSLPTEGGRRVWWLDHCLSCLAT